MLVIIIVYLTCTVIELRIYLIEKYMSWVNNVSAKIEEKINDFN